MSFLDRIINFFRPKVIEVERSVNYVKNARRHMARYGCEEPNIVRLKKQQSALQTEMRALKKENRRGAPTAKDYHRFKFLKDEIRYHHLAFNFITDMNYHNVESNCDSSVQINKLFPIVLAYEPIFRPYSRFEGKIAAHLDDVELYKELNKWLQ